MKAIILAAGYATRLYPLTVSQPKHLLKVAGKHILDYNLEKMEKIKMLDFVYVVTNNKFYQNFLDWKAGLTFSKGIKIINDGTIENQTRLGAIGDLNLILEQENIDDDILVIAGDNLFEFELTDLIKQFEKDRKSIIAVYDVQSYELARLYGIVEANPQKMITDFVEKPQQPKSTLASTGVYVFPKESLKLIREYLDNNNNPDKPGDYISWLYKKEEVYTFTFSGRWFDVGSLDQLKEADAYFIKK